MLSNNKHLAELLSNEQTIRARVELYNGSTLAKICECGEILSDFNIEKTGENKFFGFGICQKLRATLIDLDNVIDIDAVDSLEASFGVDGDFVYPYPKFYLEKADRDEVFGVIDIEAYDALYDAAKHTIKDLKMPIAYSMRQLAQAIGYYLGLPILIDSSAESAFGLIYENNANFDGTESLRTALDAIAEATQTIYYIDGNWNLYFKRLDIGALPVATIAKSQYIGLTDEGERTLSNLAHITELGDNLEVITNAENDTQYIRNNPLWELREDVASLLEEAHRVVNGTTVNQFRCEWMGNYLLEIGDKIALEKEDGTRITTYVLDDNITYNGALWQINGWEFDGSDADSAANPTTLGDAINKTVARVDKVNQDISLLAQKNEEEFASIHITTDTIESQVSALDGQLSQFKLEADKALLSFKEELDTNGVAAVDTGTGFTFSKDGLLIEKTDSEINTKITEDGMEVSRSGETMLEANNQGVNAVNLNASTYLIIGGNSRFETYEGRTACFWIGG